MRTITPGARLGTLALALAAVTVTAIVTAPQADAGAPRSKKKSLATCSGVEQRDRADEDGLDFTASNSCGAPIACTIKWTTVCAPDVKSRRKSRSESVTLRMEDGADASASALAGCGVDGWTIKDISWTCDVAKD